MGIHNALYTFLVHEIQNSFFFVQNFNFSLDLMIFFAFALKKLFKKGVICIEYTCLHFP